MNDEEDIYYVPPEEEDEFEGLTPSQIHYIKIRDKQLKYQKERYQLKSSIWYHDDFGGAF